MKKVLLAGFIFGCLSIAGLHAQKPQSKAAPVDSASTPGNPSTTREARPIGKGSPLIQRQGATTGDSKASEAVPSPAAPTEKATDKSTEKATTGKGASKPKSDNAPQQ